MEKLEHTVFQISELIGKERFGTLSEEENEVLEESGVSGIPENTGSLCDFRGRRLHRAAVMPLCTTP